MAIPAFLAANPQLTLAGISTGAGLISNLLGGRRAKKDRKRVRQDLATSGLVSALTKGRSSIPVDTSPSDPGFGERLAGGVSTGANLVSAGLQLRDAARMTQSQLDSAADARAASQRAANVAAGGAEAQAQIEKLRQQILEDSQGLNLNTAERNAALQLRLDELDPAQLNIPGNVPGSSFNSGLLSGLGQQREALRQVSRQSASDALAQQVSQRAQVGTDLAVRAADRADAALQVNTDLRTQQLTQAQQKLQQEQNQIVDLVSTIQQNPMVFREISPEERKKVAPYLGEDVLQSALLKPMSPAERGQVGAITGFNQNLQAYKRDFLAAEGVAGFTGGMRNLPGTEAAATMASLEQQRSSLTLSLRNMREAGIMTEPDFQRNLLLIPDPGGVYKTQVKNFDVLQGITDRTSASLLHSLNAMNIRAPSIQDLGVQPTQQTTTTPTAKVPSITPASTGMTDEQLEDLIRRADAGDANAAVQLYQLQLGAGVR